MSAETPYETSGSLTIEKRAETTAVEFLAAVYPEPIGHLAVFGLPSARTLWVEAGNWQAAAAAAKELLAQGQNVYFGVCLQNKDAAVRAVSNGRPADPECVRGGADTAILLPAIYAEIDCRSPGKPDAPTIDEALRELQTLPLASSIVVRSGWGLHAYWLFREPLSLTGEDRQAGAAALIGWEAFIRERFDVRGWKLDKVSDLARDLRLPGTFNLKYGERRPVTVDLFEPNRRYNLSDFGEFAPATPQGERGAGGTVTPESQVPIEERREQARRYIATLPPGNQGEKGSDRTFIAALAAVRGFILGDDEAISVLSEFNERCKPPWSPSELRHKVESARETGMMPWGKLLGSTRPIITIEAGKLPAAVDAAEWALEGSGIYQRGGLLARVGHTAPVTVKGVTREPSALAIIPITTPALVENLTRRGDFRKWDGRAKRLVPINCPIPVAATLLARREWSLPNLAGIAPAPTMRPDGSLLQTVGYDDATGLFLDFGGVMFPEIPGRLSRQDAERSLKILLELLRGFPFVDESDRSTSIAAMLTALVRRSLRSSPLFTFTAPKPRSGKTLDASLGGLLVTGHRPTTISYSGDPAEERKKLFSVLLAGDPCILIDNVSGELKGDTLCTILTEPVWSDRRLGENTTATVPTAATFTASGNNLTVSGDLSSRVLPCEIEPTVERPEEREFGVDLYEEVPRRRAELVTAGLTILRAYWCAGRPPQGRPKWGGFDEWCRWIRDPLVWLGCTDPCQGRKKVLDADPVRMKLAALLAAWEGAFGKEAKTGAEVVTLLARTPTYVNEPMDNETPETAALRDWIARITALREAVLEVAGTIRGDVDTKKLGYFMRDHARRIENGRRFVADGTAHGGAMRWRAETI